MSRLYRVGEFARLTGVTVRTLHQYDMSTTCHLRPESLEAQELADRWSAMMECTMTPYQSKPDLTEAIGEHYRAGSFEAFEGAPSAEDFAFILAAQAAQWS